MRKERLSIWRVCLDTTVTPMCKLFFSVITIARLGSRISATIFTHITRMLSRYQRLDCGSNDFLTKCSVARENRIKDIVSEGTPRTVDDVLGIMGDNEDSRFPVWRSGKYPDLWATMSLGS